MTPQASTRSAIWRNGLIFGAIIAVLGLLSVALNWQLGSYNFAAQLNPSATTPADPLASILKPSTFLGCGLFLVDLALVFVAGMLTARKTGTVGSASVAGLIAWLLGALVGGVAGIILVFAVILPQIQVPSTSVISQSQFTSIIIGSTIFGAIIGLVVDAGIGAGIGALGGLVGRNQFAQANPAPTYQPSFYGAPAGGFAPPPPAVPGGFAPPPPPAATPAPQPPQTPGAPPQQG